MSSVCVYVCFENTIHRLPAAYFSALQELLKQPITDSFTKMIDCYFREFGGGRGEGDEGDSEEEGEGEIVGCPW